MKRRRSAPHISVKPAGVVPEGATRAGAVRGGAVTARARRAGGIRGRSPRAGVTAIVVAAGAGTRLGRKIDKAFVPVGGKPLLLYSLEAFQKSPDIQRVVVVVRKSAIPACRALVKRASLKKVEAIVAGGLRRQDSVRNGLRFAVDSEFALVHDAARPFLSERLIASTLAACRRAGAAIAAEPVSDTVKQVRNGSVARTVPRTALWFAQTPQAFRRELLERAFERWPDRLEATDDALLLERMGVRIAVVRGDSLNIKITYPRDILLAESLLKARKRRNKW